MKDVISHLRSALAGRYTLERELGRGGMATVWLARDEKHGRLVALKVLNPELGQALGPERFLREIQIAARLTHPHILPLHDSGLATAAASTAASPTAVSPSAEFLYYTMPYVEGESLRDRLNREKQLPLDDALQIAREVADALSYAHSHDVVHRDIKPENILLQAGHAVVADFGIARAITAAGGEQLTQTGVAVGTPPYMSPEQAAGSQDLDGRSDLYSLGCVLYEMLAGRPPFVGPTVGSVVHQHLTAEAPAITSLRPAVPAHVTATLQRALAKTPADRFSPVALFAEALGPRTVGTAPKSVPPSRSRPWQRAALLGGGALVVLAGAMAAAWWLRSRPGASPYPRTAIAVLPLENLSGEGPNAYFAGGLHDELLTQLAKVAALQVIGRTSVMGYAGTTKRLREIGDELAVGSLVEGSVQVVGDRLRVTVQLIDPVTEAHLWAERYDRTLDDAFAVQSDIAQQIVAAVGATLAATERDAIAAPPTASPEAYRLYLQGREYYRRPGFLRRNYDIAQQFYERALAIDSTFALAYAALADLHGYISWFRYDPSSERLQRQRRAAEAALRLAPDLAQAHLAMGQVHYRGERDWQAALDEFRIALEGLPGDAEVWQEIANTNRRLGRWSEALAAFEKGIELNPRYADLFWDFGGHTYRLLHRYGDAIRMYDRALTLAPDLRGAAISKGFTYVLWRGQLDTLRAALTTALAQMSAMDAANARGGVDHMELWLMERQPDSLIQALMAAQRPVYEGISDFLPASLFAAWAHQLQNSHAAAHAAFDSALAVVDSVLRVRPDDDRLHQTRGIVLAGLGSSEDARREAEWISESPVYQNDAYFRGRLARYRAWILAQTGDVEAALAEIEQLLAGPSESSVHTLRLDPRWDPIRNDPRFQALLVKYANPRPIH